MSPMTIKLSDRGALFSLLSASGVVLTAIAAVKDHDKAKEKISSLERERGCVSKKDRVLLSLPCYIPSLVIGGITIGCIGGASYANNRTITELTGLVSYMTGRINSFSKQVDTKLGRNISDAIKDDAAKIKMAKVRRAPRIDQEMTIFIEFSGTYVTCSYEQLLDAEIALNRNLAIRGWATYNEFLSFLDTSVTFGDDYGWCLYLGEIEYGYYCVDFVNHLHDEDPDNLFYVVTMPFEPQPLEEFEGEY